ncbi:MAG: ATP phosphoribosyltransferase regulatory subunit [Sporolactobacillus sp.]|nr:ATP phosphoribosyltransferase regulatory subunit [Sporolactobacillus sp.]
MTQPYMFEKPLGLRDTLPESERAIAGLEALFRDELLRWGYDFLKTPALEYAETVGRASAIADTRLFKFLDVEGRPVVLRPDMTTPIARVVASSLRNQTPPLRLCYTAALYRSQQKEGGHPSEFEQTGAELIGDASADADAEVISLMLTLLKKAGLPSVRLALGHVGFVDAFFNDCTHDSSAVTWLHHLLFNKDDVGFHEYVNTLNLTPACREKLHSFVASRRLDNKRTMAYMRSLAIDGSAAVRDCFHKIAALFDLMKADRIDSCIDLDITLMPHLSYYTGAVFQGFGGELGFPIASGGRYDNLLDKFNRPSPATGFGIRLDRVMSASASGGRSVKPHKTAVIYDREHAAKAKHFAEEKRGEGRPVVLQHVGGIEDLQAFTERFEHVKTFLNVERREIDHD